MKRELQSRQGPRGVLALGAALAFLSCQETFRFVSLDGGVADDGGPSDGGDAGSDAGDSGVDAGPDAGPDAGMDAGDSGMDAGFTDGTICVDDGQCMNGSCLGRCCSVACATQDTDCGATACGDAGECVYPDAGTACGMVAPVCAGAQLTLYACDGKGDCRQSVELCPGGFACNPGGSGCAAECGPGACPNNAFCDPVQTECCPIGPGNAMHVDGTTGSDRGCCGTPAQPCQTLTRTMQLVEAFGVPNFDLIVAGGLEHANDGGIDWTNAESWPVRLNLGVKVIAPNVHFVPPVGSPATAFEVNADSPFDTTPVEILGQMGAPVIVGIDTRGENLASTTIAIDDGASVDGGYNLPLTLQNVWLNATQVGLRVGPGASVSLGDVAIGSASNSYYIGGTMPVNGSTGILCVGSATEPAALNAIPPPYYTTLLAIDSQSKRDIDAEGYCQMSLDAVTLGAAPPLYPAGVASCLAKLDSTGLYAVGPSQMTFSQLTAQCMDGWGAYLMGTDAGAPLVKGPSAGTLYATFQNCGCSGVYLAGGAQLNAEVNIHYCQVGLQIDDDWRMVPGTFTPSPPTYIGCNSAAEPSDVCRRLAGVDYLNTTSATTADAHGIAWDQWSDAGTTQVWACSDGGFTSCVCQGPLCSGAAAQPLPDDADAVYLIANTAAKPFDFKGGSASFSGCN